MEDLNVNLVRLNLIEEKLGSSLEWIGIGNYFLYMTPVAQLPRSTIDKWDLMKLKSFCKTKGIVTRTKHRLQNGKRSSSTPHLTEG